jgi:cytochrome b6-f complex iron-sulfur subunit
MDDSTEKTPRRQFLVRTGQLLLGACAVTGVVGAWRFSASDFSDGPSRHMALGTLSSFKMNTLTWLRQRDLFVMRDAGGMGVFSARCTHLGCTIQRTSKGFACPCHGATFGKLGQVVTGPARKPLPWYRIWLESDGRLWVDLEDIREKAGTVKLKLPAETAG